MRNIATFQAQTRFEWIESFKDNDVNDTSVVCVLFFIVSISLEVRTYNGICRYYNDCMTEWAILQFIAAFLVLQIAGCILKLRKVCAVSIEKQ